MAFWQRKATKRVKAHAVFSEDDDEEAKERNELDREGVDWLVAAKRQKGFALEDQQVLLLPYPESIDRRN